MVARTNGFVPLHTLMDGDGNCLWPDGAPYNTVEASIIYCECMADLYDQHSRWFERLAATHDAFAEAMNEVLEALGGVPLDRRGVVVEAARTYP